MFDRNLLETNKQRFIMEWLRSYLVSLLHRASYFVFIGTLFLIWPMAVAGGNGAVKYELNLVIGPPLIFINKSREVEFSVLVLKGINDVVDTVRLVQTNAKGNPIAEIGNMTDDGQNGDFDAGDGEYTTTVTMHEPVPDTRYYQAIVSLKNDSRKILSGVAKFYITEEPYTKNPDEDKLVHGLGAPFPVNQVILDLREGETKATAEALAKLVGGTIVGYTPVIDEYLLEVPSTTVEELDAIIEKLKKDPRAADAVKNPLLGEVE